jgi:hypothetical protein
MSSEDTSRKSREPRENWPQITRISQNSIRESVQSAAIDVEVIDEDVVPTGVYQRAAGNDVREIEAPK